jgi:beta-glucosidase
MNKILDWNKYLDTAAQTVAEGIVMLKNENAALPLRPDETVSVFGRIQLHYYKSGTGSGGMVNVSKVTGITDGLLEAGVCLNQPLLDTYKKWDCEHPFDLGTGWGNEPWSQEEMPLTDELAADAASISETALVIIGRTAGEEMDVRYEPGSFLLTDAEKDMLATVRRHFKRMIVLLNVGGLIDMNYIESCKPDSVLYVWQGGMTGGTGTALVLTGKVSPCGKLPDSIALSLDDYPSSNCFGNTLSNSYCEGIYVGYRWFSTFAPEKVRYPFGFGLSYTTFSLSPKCAYDAGSHTLKCEVTVTNTGAVPGKEVVQIYCGAPQGKLGKPAKVLCGFAKTGTLLPGQSETVNITVKGENFASYDDTGVTGHKSCWVLEAGDYLFYIGTDSSVNAPSFIVPIEDTTVISQCTQALTPVTPFRQARPVSNGNGGFKPVYEDVSLNDIDEKQRRIDMLPEEIPQTGDKGIKLRDVAEGRHSMNEFIAQLSDNDLACIVRGEGMGSPRVTAGTASAFGGVTDSLASFGIPAGCCSDGPSGMRLDCGTKAFSLPNGTMIASTFNTELVQELFSLLGLEMAANKVDCLLGPGMNIHRHPLNGRNFEYFSEDPFLTGTMAQAELKGLHSSGVTGTIKHFCGNNQETNRHFLDTVASERALREIYLKGFEIAVREGGADSIMTTYGKLNGVWTAGNFDLDTIVLRKDWGFTGFTMTDWWANINRRGGDADKSDFAAMAMAQNDVYMVCADTAGNKDNLMESLQKGELKRCELQRNAANICRFLLHTNALGRLTGTADTIEITGRPAEDMPSDEPVVFYDIDRELTLSLEDASAEKDSSYVFALTVNNPGFYDVTITASSELGELAQIPVTIFAMGTASGTFTFNGTNGKSVSITKNFPMFSRFTAIRLYFAQNGLRPESITFRMTRAADDISIAFKQED